MTSAEAKQIADLISPIYRDHLSNYSFKKYPAAAYEGYKKTYSALKIPNSAIYGSLVWKWGHVGKKDFIGAHKELIREVEALWPKYVALRRRPPLKTYSAADTFQWWAGRLRDRANRDRAYITVAFITHLVHHAEDLPIIDQHNFRAMNCLMKRVQKTHAATKSPRTLEDIMRLKAFMTEVLVHLPKATFGEFDRFLMMFGKSVKPRKPSSSQVNNIDAPTPRPTKRGDSASSTASSEFRKRAIRFWKNGNTQTIAMQKAADELGIALKRSYVDHPGSHFGRWRQQGHLK